MAGTIAGIDLDEFAAQQEQKEQAKLDDLYSDFTPVKGKGAKYHRRKYLMDQKKAGVDIGRLGEHILESIRRPPKYMPIPDDELMDAENERKYAKQRRAGGQLSTVLTDQEGSLG